MTRHYLCAWDEDGERFAHVSNSPCSHVAQDHGQASVIMPARPGDVGEDVVTPRLVVLLVPRSPSAVLAILMNDVGTEISGRTFVSHGHASVLLLLRGEDDWIEIREQVLAYVVGHEIWTLDETGRIDPERSEVHEPLPSEVVPPIDEIDDGQLPYEAAAQVRQFNANIFLLQRICSFYAPEVLPLVSALARRVGEIADRLRRISQDPETSDAGLRESVSLETVLVETNAVLTLYCSQLGSGALPLNRALFPVGEYSLLGIGAACRSAWRIYLHLNKVFANFDHVGKLRANVSVMGGFDWRSASTRRDFSSWASAQAALAAAENRVDDDPRLHIPYFSSRWGFHESLHSISLSWQCLYSAATKEWNLLTITHEFLHSQVRAMFALILNPTEAPDLIQEVADSYNRRDLGEHAIDSLRLAYAEALVGARNGCNMKSRVAEGTTSIGIDGPLNAQLLRELSRDHSALVHEVAVHVLDFRYVYNSREQEYVNSLWSSWSLVPGVADRVEVYVLRTLLALSTNTHTASNDFFSLFERTRARLLEQLQSLREHQPSTRPAIDAAIAVLEDSTTTPHRLAFEFIQFQYVVQMTQHFFFDRRVNAELVRDPSAEVRGGESTYGISPGEYVDNVIGSPIAFLLERFGDYEDQAGSEAAEYETMWQMLQLI